MKKSVYPILNFIILLFVVQLTVSCSSTKDGSLPCSSFSENGVSKGRFLQKKGNHRILKEQHARNKQSGTDKFRVYKPGRNKTKNSSELVINQNERKDQYQIHYLDSNDDSELLIASTDMNFIPVKVNKTEETLNLKLIPQASETENINQLQLDCDVIILNNGDEIECKILEVTESKVKYKKCDYLEEPAIVIDRSEIFMIKYANGTKELVSAGEERSKPKAKLEGFGLVALILGLVGWLTPVGAAVILCSGAFIFGMIGLIRSNGSPWKFKGKGFAIAGLIIGMVGLVIILLFMV